MLSYTVLNIVEYSMMRDVSQGDRMGYDDVSMDAFICLLRMKMKQSHPQGAIPAFCKQMNHSPHQLARCKNAASMVD